MKEESHRASEVCEKSVDKTTHRTKPRRLDGHSLYSAQRPPGPWDSKPIIAKFDQPHASSDGGAILLKAVDDRLGLTWRLASAIRDRRQPGKVAHPLRDLLRQRVFGLACGYADCNDAGRLVDDPIHKLLLDRDPLEGAGLGSQPTLSRFENAVGRADLYRLGTTLADAVLTHHRARLGDTVRLITIDLDATDDPTHGQQEFA